MKQKFLKEDHIMIKHFAKPFNVVYRTENSLNKKIESIKDQIEFEKYKLQNNGIESLIFTQEENNERIDKLEKELEYYQEIIELKWDDSYFEGVIGGWTITSGAVIAAVGISLCIKKITKK